MHGTIQYCTCKKHKDGVLKPRQNKKGHKGCRDAPKIDVFFINCSLQPGVFSSPTLFLGGSGLNSSSILQHRRRQFFKKTSIFRTPQQSFWLFLFCQDFSNYCFSLIHNYQSESLRAGKNHKFLTCGTSMPRLIQQGSKQSNHEGPNEIRQYLLQLEQ